MHAVCLLCAQAGEFDRDHVDVVCRWSPVAKRNVASTVLNDKVYIFGGYNGSLVLNDFHEF